MEVSFENKVSKIRPRKPNEEVKPEAIVVIIISSDTYTVNRLIVLLLVLRPNHKELQYNIQKEQKLTNC